MIKWFFKILEENGFRCSECGRWGAVNHRERQEVDLGSSKTVAYPVYIEYEICECDCGHEMTRMVTGVTPLWAIDPAMRPPA